VVILNLALLALSIAALCLGWAAGRAEGRDAR